MWAALYPTMLKVLRRMWIDLANVSSSTCFETSASCRLCCFGPQEHRWQSTRLWKFGGIIKCAVLMLHAMIKELFGWTGIFCSGRLDVKWNRASSAPPVSVPALWHFLSPRCVWSRQTASTRKLKLLIKLPACAWHCSCQCFALDVQTGPLLIVKVCVLGRTPVTVCFIVQTHCGFFLDFHLSH